MEKPETQYSGTRSYKYKFAVSLIFLIFVAFSLFGCSQNQLSAEKAGKSYGVTKGAFLGDWWDFYERGVSFADGEFWPQAETDFRQAISLWDSDQTRMRTYGMHFIDYFPRRELGMVFFHRKQYAEAIVELETSIKSQRSAKAEFYLDKARKARIERDNLDITPPEIFIESPAEGELTNASEVTVKGFAKDDQFVRHVRINGEELPIFVSEIEIPFEKKVAVEIGQPTIIVEAVDLAGKTTEKQISIRCDRVGPVLGIDALAPTGRVKNEYRIRGYATDSSEIVHIRIDDSVILKKPVTDFEIDHPFILKPNQDFAIVSATDKADNTTIAKLPLRPASASANRLYASLGKVADIAKNSDATYYCVVAGANDPIIEVKDWPGKRVVIQEEIMLELRLEAHAEISGLSINGKSVVLKRPAHEIYYNRILTLSEDEDNLFVIECADSAGRKSSKICHVFRKKPEIRQIGSRMSVVMFPFVQTGSREMAVEKKIHGAIVTGKRFNMHPRITDPKYGGKSEWTDETMYGALQRARSGNIEFVLIGDIEAREKSLDISVSVVESENNLELTYQDVYGEDLGHKGVETLCKGLALKLREALPVVEGKIAQIKDGDIIINLGENEKIVKGMHLLFFDRGETIPDPATGEARDPDLKILGTARILEADEMTSHAEPLNPDDLPKLEIGKRLITK